MNNYFDIFNPMHFKKFSENRKIALFGASNTMLQALNEDGIKNKVVKIVDNDENKWGRRGGYVVEPPNVLAGFDGVVLITSQYVYEIIEQLDWLGVQYYFHYETIKFIEKSGQNIDEVDSGFVNSDESRHVWENIKCCASALGVVDEIEYTNSQDAFYISYQKGYRMFECDLREYDSDILLCHGGECLKNVYRVNGDYAYFLTKNTFNQLDEFGYPLSVENFKKEKIFGKYEVATLHNIIDWLTCFDDTYFVLDNHGNTKQLFRILASINEKLRERIVIQLGIRQLNNIDEIRKYGIKLIDLIDDSQGLYYNRCTVNELVRTCVNYNIAVLSFGKKRINKPLVEMAKKHGIRIRAYSQVNSKQTVERLQNMGVDILCTQDYFVDKCNRD